MAAFVDYTVRGTAYLSYGSNWNIQQLSEVLTYDPDSMIIKNIGVEIVQKLYSLIFSSNNFISLLHHRDKDLQGKFNMINAAAMNVRNKYPVSGIVVNNIGNFRNRIIDFEIDDFSGGLINNPCTGGTVGHRYIKSIEWSWADFWTSLEECNGWVDSANIPLKWVNYVGYAGCAGYATIQASTIIWGWRCYDKGKLIGTARVVNSPDVT